MSITRRNNLLTTLSGQTPAWVPFAPNFFQWFIHHQKSGTLPDDLKNCADYIDAMKFLDCDIFSRNIDGGVRGEDSQAKAVRTITQSSTGLRTILSYETPFGTLRHVIQEQTAISTSHDEEYFVKDWATDGDAFRWLLDQRAMRWDEEAFLRTVLKIGDSGLVNVACGQTPLKMLHQGFGLDYTCFFIADYPEIAKQLCDQFWQQQMMPVLRQLSEHDEVFAVILMDNVDTPFYPPSYVEEYWMPYVQEATELMTSRGKLLFVHACGKLAELTPLFAKCRVSGLEGISHPPLGDWPGRKAQDCHKNFIFIGGFSAREQELFNDDQVKAFYREYLPTLRTERCIFASSCQTSIGTSWERIKLVRDICREWGGMPHV